MQITILALGSLGDIQPFIPLGCALQARGYRVRIATFRAYEPLISASGLGFHPLRGDAKALVQAAGQGMLDGRINPLTTYQALRRSFLSLGETLGEDLSAPALRDTQLLLNQLPGNFYGYDLADALGIPEAILAVIPLAPTRTLNALSFPGAFSRIPGYNLLTHRLAEHLAWAMFGKFINQWRKDRLSLSPYPPGGPFEDIRRRKIPILNGFSEYIVPRPPDWGSHIHITGWWLPDYPDWHPPAELQRFLSAGDPPVFIGFGSMPVKNPRRLATTLIEAVQRSGQRAIVHTGWAELEITANENIFPLRFAPYGWLFPRMSAVIHHGGSGTSGFAFESGVPALTIPFGFDQFYWGKRAAELGVGPRPLPFKQLDANRLADAIQTMTGNVEMRHRAAKLGEKVRADNGIQRAVDLIDQML